MYLKRILLITAGLILLVHGSGKAQTGGINFMLGFPMGEFKENVKRTGIGVSAEFLFFTPQERAPFTIGLNLGYLNYGSESRREPFSTTIPDVTVDVDRTNNIANFHLLFKLMLPTGPVRPYMEGLFGGSYLFTETQIKSRGSQEVAGNTNFDDFTWSYGAGGGFLIQLTDTPDEDVTGVFLDFKVRYLFGAPAEYLKEGSVLIENGRVTYQVTESKTDLLTANLGVTAYFNSLFNR